MRGDGAAKSVGPTVCWLLAERVTLTQSPAGGCSQLSCLLSTCPTLFWKEYWVLSLPVMMTRDTVSQPRTCDAVLTAQAHFTQPWMLSRLSVHKDRGQCQWQGWGRHLMLKEGSHYISSLPPSPPALLPSTERLNDWYKATQLSMYMGRHCALSLLSLE